MAEILVVEDYPPMASALARMLRMRGHHVVSELSVAGALRHSRAFEYAVLDIDLPDGNGVALAEHLVSQQRVRGIAFFTATCEPKTLSRAGQLGLVISKTQGVERLVEAVGRLGQCAGHFPCHEPERAPMSETRDLLGNARRQPA
jgi:DNA-binding NarL/FixJ family response regulator